MTQENKNLLLKDLSARLPYGVVVHYCKKTPTLYTCDFELNERLLLEFRTLSVELKPYLRPMSSMTEEEKEKYHELCDSYYGIYFDTIDSIDYLNSIHIDYRGLIPKYLAIEVTEENNPYKE